MSLAEIHRIGVLAYRIGFGCSCFCHSNAACWKGVCLIIFLEMECLSIHGDMSYEVLISMLGLFEQHLMWGFSCC